MLRPEPTNKTFYALTQAKAKMYEYAVPEERHINLRGASLTDMLDLTIGILGDLTARREIGNFQQEKYSLLFSAQYLTALIESESISHSHTVLKLLASAAYYLSDYPGSSSVVLESIANTENCTDMEKVLFSILKRSSFIPTDSSLFNERIQSISRLWEVFLTGVGENTEELESEIDRLRSEIYSDGKDDELLFIDIIRTLVNKRINVSAKKILLQHSGIDIDLWNTYLVREHSLKELWPSQVKLAENNVFDGVSAVIQMPTSAGKTRATELIIRSSFLSRRSSVAVIVAPYRSLCQEIYNDFSEHFNQDDDIDLDIVSDVLQNDFSLVQGDMKSILILTPEKLDFMLRHDPDFAERIGLIIYDEGHLFDEQSRGIKYELLLSSLKLRLPESAQVVLISAVISNAQQIKDWLIGPDGVLVDGSSLSPTSRNVAFAQWTQINRNLQFVDQTNINNSIFWVPTVLQSYELELKEGERAPRHYPKKDAGGDYNAGQVAGLLGCRMSVSGATAIFTGKKQWAQKIIKDIVDAYDRNLPVDQPLTFSEDLEQAEKVSRYISETLGENSENTLASRLGILVHHANIPHGLRLVTEHSISKGFFKSVVCTSTLAQGVNLPIRYLVVASYRQNRDIIKTRDFYNLMGRAGRSGKYVEGTVIFADPKIYRDKGRRSRLWRETQDLMDRNNAEPSMSRLQILLTERPSDEDEDAQMEWDFDVKIVKDGIYSYLITALSDIEDVRESEDIILNLVKSTLGYNQLTTDEQKTELAGIFLGIANDIMTSVPELANRYIFSKSILNFTESSAMIESIQEIETSLVEAIENDSDLLDVLWPILFAYSTNRVLKSFNLVNGLCLCKEWITGTGFNEILAVANEMARDPNGTLTVIDIVGLCEGSLSYECSTLLGSIMEINHLALAEDLAQSVNTRLSILQKRLKYGVPGLTESIVYEMGLTDRSLSIRVTSLLDDTSLVFKNDVKRAIRNHENIQPLVEENYPEYFNVRLNQIITE